MSLPESRHIEFLTSLGGARSCHTGRTLNDHLAGTFKILDAWGCAEYLKGAGLFHSVYGTTFYESDLTRIPTRSEVAGLIGTRAEKLVYVFCRADRETLLLGEFNQNGDLELPNLGLILPKTEANDLLLIEIANILEQLEAIVNVPEDEAEYYGRAFFRRRSDMGEDVYLDVQRRFAEKAVDQYLV